MARRGFGGMTALRAALGAAVGVGEGLQQREVLAAQKKKDEEAARIQRIALLNQLGFRPEMARMTADPAAREAFALETPQLPSPTMGSSQMSNLFAKATQRDMKVSPDKMSLARPVELTGTPFQQAMQKVGLNVRPDITAAPVATTTPRKPLDDTRLRQFERGAAMQAATPEMQTEVPGVGKIAWRGPQTEEEKTALELSKRRKELELTQEFDEKRLNTERERMRSVYRAAYPMANAAQVEAMANGIKPDDMGLEILTPSQKRAEARQNRLDDLDRRYKEAQIKKMSEDAATSKPLTPSEYARLSEAQANAIEAQDKMQKIEDSWLKDKPQIGALDVGSVQELMEGKGMSLNKAVASVWGSSVNPFSTDPATMQQLQDYLSMAKMHSNAIRLIAARGGSNLLQQTEQQLVNAAWAGGDAADIERARSARMTINNALIDAYEASGLNLQLQRAAEKRKFDNNNPANPMSPAGSFPSFDEWKKTRGTK